MFHLLGVLATVPGPFRQAPSFAARRLAIGIFAVLGLSACASTKPVVIERPVEVVRIVYVPIDPALTSHGEVPGPRTNTGREALRVNAARKAELVLCYGKLDAISSVQGTEKPAASAPTPADPKP